MRRSNPSLCILTMSLACLHGCASKQLQRSTVRQVRTLTDLQYQQVLDNLAMYKLNREALPGIAVLKTGATQVGDTGSLGFYGVAGIETKFGASPTIMGTRSIVDQWGLVPVTDDNALKLLRKAFQCATGSRSLLSRPEAEDLAHDLSAQIGTNADISVDGDTLRSIYNYTLRRSGMAPIKPPTQSSRTPNLRAPTELTPEQERLELEQAAREAYSEEVSQRIVSVYEKVDSKITSTLDKDVLSICYDEKGVLKFCPYQRASTGLAKETIRRLNDIQDTLATIPSDWFEWGCEKPKDACFVGHAVFCGRECYVWVCEDHLRELSDFTLAILKLASAIKDVQVVSVPSGIQFSPALANQPR